MQPFWFYMLGAFQIDCVFSVSVHDMGSGGWYSVGRQRDYLMETALEEVKAVNVAGPVSSGSGVF